MKYLWVMLVCFCFIGCKVKEARICMVDDVTVTGGGFLSPTTFHFSCEDGRSSLKYRYVKPGDEVCLATGRLGNFYPVSSDYCE